MTSKRLVLLLITLLGTPTAAMAQEVVRSDLSVNALLSTVIYGLIGIILCVAGYFAFDKIAGLSLKHELVEDQNIAIGIMLAGVFIGIALVVAAVMLS